MNIVIKLFNQKDKTTEFFSISRVMDFMKLNGFQMSIVCVDDYNNFEIFSDGTTKTEAF